MAKISDKDKEYLLSIKPEELTFTKLVELFGDTLKQGDDIKNEKHSHFNTTDDMTLLPNEYFVKEKTDTTVGRFIYNKYIVERIGLQNVLGYINFTITDGNNSKIENILSKALIDDKMTIKQFHQYIDLRDNLGMQLHSVITTSFTQNTIKILPEVKKRRKELFKQYEKELASGDIITSEKIEKELTSMSKKILKGDPGMDLYNSEARGNFGNYKNMNLFKGATMNNITGEYEIVKSAFMDGIQKEDLQSFGTAVVSGSYPKAVGTQESGYLTKQLLAAMQQETLDVYGSDCGTNKTIDVELFSEKEAFDFEYRYIVEGNKLVCLTPDIMKKYIGKTVKMRSPVYCKGECVCNKCAGDLNYKLGNMNIGLGTSKISTTLLRLGMKKFHISNLKSIPIDIDDIFV